MWGEEGGLRGGRGVEQGGIIFHIGTIEVEHVLATDPGAGEGEGSKDSEGGGCRAA